MLLGTALLPQIKEPPHAPLSPTAALTRPARRGRSSCRQPRCSAADAAAPELHGTDRSAAGGESRQQPPLPTLADITAVAAARDVVLELDTFAFLFFTASAFSAAPGRALLGRAHGFCRPSLRGPVLHIDSIRMAQIESSKQRPVFGLALFIGALVVRFGLERGCRTAELLAINDTDEYHQKLVRYYGRLGFKTVRVVEGGSLGDLAHMLVWGGVGTRMDGDIEQLLARWSKVLRPEPAAPGTAAPGGSARLFT